MVYLLQKHGSIKTFLHKQGHVWTNDKSEAYQYVTKWKAEQHAERLEQTGTYVIVVPAVESEQLEVVSMPSEIIVVWRFGNELRRYVQNTNSDDDGSWVCPNQFGETPTMWKKTDIPLSALVSGF
jgi:hypothetical protein